ncbi:conserved hypothetical protein [Pectobacterium atrosepticum SCRI1043]|uniref:Uncharacterized protein n=1 Tax=Pectobacterium atrosepticum (strain SCRI 1043 / ATCC BAA-672) TaxID=218491 RepID=Q6CZ59_PECAS|nr:hypothetical protein [Pectobacterium atrosepticum]GKV87621.1 hypothetical protein PEC301296_39320 [Pectobacterium carotovorum subsp. carotovorum]AIA73057.1 hypothetical protein EV46_21390 [Pectobacterium atrosepticum]AIK16040.1 hypothetical protein GZ59_43530 [Pectobacterium atrosepticum]ATY92721.1 hypothetical protein CVS35_21430 [Pectobacterium atrosepticum]KFX13301.1 hypothetical protein JV34_15915 [Pectobacterium atrosepticum]
MNDKFIVEPIEFAFTKGLFKGLCDVSFNDVVIIKNIDDAIEFAFEQNLPSNYKVWNDIIESYREELREHTNFQNALDFINNKLEFFQHQNSSLHLEYRKKKIKKSNSKHDDFIFSESKEDAYFVLSTIAINRYLNNFIDDGFLERLFSIYKSGGWPCGMKRDSIIVFDPAVLM